MKRIAFSLVALSLITACSNADPIGEAKGPSTGQESPSAGPTLAPPAPPAPPSDPDVPNDHCDFMKSWCAQPYVWPESEHMATYLGRPQQCYCRCDPNGLHLDCAGAPNGPADCGVIMDPVIKPDGTLTYKPRFEPTGEPLVCRESMTKQAM